MKSLTVFNLELSMPINPVPTYYTDNFLNTNSVIDFMFLYAETKEFNNHQIMLELQSLSNHIPLSVSIIIEEKYIQRKKQTIIKNSEEEKTFCQ